MKLLRVIATLDPKHGGPAAGLRAITPQLKALGHETTFVSLDAPDVVSQFGLDAPSFGLGPARGGYAYSPLLEPWLREHAAEYDAVFVHGLWQHHGRAVRAALRKTSTPYFVFPHGMLDPWFRRAYPLKHVKKWLYWQVCERHVLHDAAAVFFTCHEERRLARQSFRPYSCTERVVAYGTAAPKGDDNAQRREWRGSVPELAGRPFWLFLGRIHPKKGADLLLHAYADVCRRTSGPMPALVVAGPFSDRQHESTLREIAKTVPANGLVLWPGMLEGARKWGALRDAEVFALPSHQENFGIAVAEALAVGTPVLISRKVNIWEEIESEGAGFADTDDVAGTIRLLERWQSSPSADRRTMAQAALELFQTRYEIGRVAQSLVESVAPFLHRTPSHHTHEALPAKKSA